MVNTDDFIKRIEIILDYYSLTASSFADKIGVQRSSVSHLLSGRNKPSLDFILKIIDIFPEVNLYWILNGKGNFPSSNNEAISNSSNTPTPVNEIQSDLFSNSGEIKDKTKLKIEEENNYKLPSNSSDIEKIVILYKDGTFSEFKPR